MIVVLGGTGFIGSAVCRRLKSRDIPFLGLGREEFVAFDGARLAAGPHPSGGWQSKMQEAPRPSAAIFAAGSSLASGDAARLKAGHLDALAAFLDRLGRHSQPRPFVFASSALVYGRRPRPDAIAEGDSVTRGFAYGEAKLDGERMVGEASRAGAIDGRVARLFNIAGRGQRAGIVADICRQAVKAPHGGTVRLRSNAPVLDFTDVRDAADGLIALALAATAPPLVNLCSGRPVTTDQLVAAAARAVGRRLSAAYDEISDRRESLVGDPALIARTTGWVAARGLDEMIADAISGHAEDRPARHG